MKKKPVSSLLLTLGFLLGIHNGYIALWNDGQTEPAEVFPYRAKMLPEADQRALEKGILIPDEKSLSSILEDYLS